MRVADGGAAIKARRKGCGQGSHRGSPFVRPDPLQAEAYLIRMRGYEGDGTGRFFCGVCRSEAGCRPRPSGQ
jgi:hypothetical protein